MKCAHNVGWRKANQKQELVPTVGEVVGTIVALLSILGIAVLPQSRELIALWF